MKKSTIALAVLAAIAAGTASAQDKASASVSGFANIKYTITDESADPVDPADENTAEGKFGADGEVDFAATPADGVTVRMDADLSLDGSESAALEQAYFAWAAAEGVTVLGGVFNNPIGYEAEDVVDMDFATHGNVYGVLDSQTALDGDNIAGLAGAFAVGPATITAAFLNDISGENEENSFALVANYAPMKGLDLELGYVTQDDDKNDNDANDIDTAGNVANFNVVYTGVENLTLGLDYLAPSELVDSVYDVWAGYNFPGGFSAKVRYSETAFNEDGAAALIDPNLTDDVTTDSTTVYLGYKIASNLSAGLEHRVDGSDADDADDKAKTQLKFVAKF